MKQMILFIGGPADGQVRSISCDEKGNPPPEFAMERVIEDYKAHPLNQLKYEVVLYRAELLIDKDQSRYFVYALPNTNVMRKLIEGYRR